MDPGTLLSQIAILKPEENVGPMCKAPGFKSKLGPQDLRSVNVSMATQDRWAERPRLMNRHLRSPG